MQPSLDKIIQIAKDAGEILHQNFDKPHQVEYKGVIDLVTEVDREFGKVHHRSNSQPLSWPHHHE